MNNPPPTRLRRFFCRRFRVWHALLAAAFLAGIAFYSAFCNLPRHAPEWTAERIDLAIDRGLEHLFNSSAFTKRYDFGGEHRIHHFLLKLVLAKEPHLRLRAQMEQCDQISQDIPKWRAFAGLPGWPVEKLDDTRRTEIQRLIREDPHPYERWMLWADHASWAKLEPDDHRTLFTDTSRQKGSYDLTHALLAYWIMLRTAPETSGHLNVNARIHEVVARTLRYSHWAPRCGDSYLERIAFLMMAEPPPRISRRWIERILTVQNEDGGWIWVPSYTRTLEEMLGLKITSLPSEPHPTFLALVALAYYRDQMRAEKTAPLPAPARTQGR